jgi:hypothetical protein
MSEHRVPRCPAAAVLENAARRAHSKAASDWDGRLSPGYLQADLELKRTLHSHWAGCADCHADEERLRAEIRADEDAFDAAMLALGRMELEVRG